MKNSVVLFLAFLLYASLAQAQAVSGAKPSRFILGVQTWFGYGSAALPTDTTAPAMGSFNVGATVGVNIKRIGLGVNYDYRIVTQHSDVLPSVGNRRGNITTLSPFISVDLNRIKLGLNYFISGQYDMMNMTANGSKLSYQKPSGFQFQLKFRPFKRVAPAIFYESMTFSEMHLDGVATPLTDKLSYTNYGIGLIYGF